MKGRETQSEEVAGHTFTQVLTECLLSGLCTAACLCGSCLLVLIAMHTPSALRHSTLVDVNNTQ